MPLKRTAKKIARTAISEAVGDNYEAWPVDEDDWDTYTQAREDFEASDRMLIKCRPPRENEGIDAAQQLLTTIHDVRTNAFGLNVSHSHSHEIWYNEGQIQFYFAPETTIDSKQFIRQIRNDYPDVDIVTGLTNPWPDIDAGDYVAAATLHPDRAFYYPLKSPFTAGEDMDVDPYGNITSDMVVERAETSDGTHVAADECRIVIQTMFHPAKDTWSKRRPCGYDVDEVAHSLKQGDIKGNIVTGYTERDATNKRKRAAKTIERQRGKKAYYVTMRVLAFSPYKEIAERRCRLVAQNYTTYHNSLTEQTLTPTPVQPTHEAGLLRKAVRREQNISLSTRLSQQKFIVTVPELAGLVHLPNEDINTPSVEWSKEASGAGVPADSPQFDELRREHNEGSDDEDDTMEVLNPGKGHTPDPTPTEQRPGAGADRTETTANRETTEDPHTRADATSARESAASSGSQSRDSPPSRTTEPDSDPSPESASKGNRDTVARADPTPGIEDRPDPSRYVTRSDPGPKSTEPDDLDGTDDTSTTAEDTDAPEDGDDETTEQTTENTRDHLPSEEDVRR